MELSLQNLRYKVIHYRLRDEWKQKILSPLWDVARQKRTTDAGDIENFSETVISKFSAALQKVLDAKEEPTAPPTQRDIKDTLVGIDRDNLPLNWQNVFDEKIYKPKWNEYGKKIIQSMNAALTDILKDVESRKNDLSHVFHVTDLTSYVMGISNFSNSLATFENVITFTFNVKDLPKVRDLYGMENPLNISENDVIEFRIKRPDETDYETDQAWFDEDYFRREFIGFVGTVSSRGRYGEFYELTVNCFGLSKFLHLTRFIIDRAAWSQFDEGGIEINNPQITMLENILADKSIFEVFDYILYNTLGLRSIKTVDKNLKTLNASLEVLDKNVAETSTTIEKLSTSIDDITKKRVETLKQKLKEYGDSKEKTGGLIKVEKEHETTLTNANYNIGKEALGRNQLFYTFDRQSFAEQEKTTTLMFLLMTLYLIKYFTEVGSGSKTLNVFAAFEGVESDNPTDANFRYYLYFVQVKKALTIYYSSLKTPAEALDLLRKIAYYDLFEDRPGMIYCRPPRYNLIDISAVKSADAFKNRSFTADQVINFEDVVEEEISREDITLNTRVDYKWFIPYVGGQPFPGAHFTDPALVINYGTRVDEPATNPLARNDTAGLLAALDLAYKNAQTRRMSLTVKNNRGYKIGRLYFYPRKIYTEKIVVSGGEIWGEGLVGYLQRISTSFDYGRLSTHSLEFSFVRRAEIVYIKDKNLLILNFKRVPDIEDFANLLKIKGVDVKDILTKDNTSTSSPTGNLDSTNEGAFLLDVPNEWEQEKVNV